MYSNTQSILELTWFWCHRIKVAGDAQLKWISAEGFLNNKPIDPIRLIVLVWFWHDNHFYSRSFLPLDCTTTDSTLYFGKFHNLVETFLSYTLNVTKTTTIRLMNGYGTEHCSRRTLGRKVYRVWWLLHWLKIGSDFMADHI